MNAPQHRKKLIEVALPLDAINKASAYEKMPGIGPHPRGLHQWWARRPLAAARAVIFAQMVDDPSSIPEDFDTEETQETERARLFEILEELVKWENTTNEELLEKARKEIWRSWCRTCSDHADHPHAAELFDPDKLPAFHDPFAGGGALPLEAQRLGLEAHASDLNPVAVLINKAMIEIPPKFAGKSPVNPDARPGGQVGAKTLIERKWKGAQGLAEDVRYYGQWMHDEAERRIGHLYPKVEITPEMVRERPDLKRYESRKLTVIAWLWARTVKSPNPAFADVDVPLASTFMLSTKKGKEAYVEPVIEGRGYRFGVKAEKPEDVEVVKRGTKSGGSGSPFLCLMSGTPMPFDYLRAEAKAGGMGTRLMAIVAEGDRGRVYLSPMPEHELVLQYAEPNWRPSTDLPKRALGFRVQEYGMTRWADLFTPRQLVALTTFSDLVAEAMERTRRDAVGAGLPNDGQPLRDGGTGATAYAEAVGVYLGFAVDRCCDFSNSCTRWVSGNQKVMSLFGKQAIAMTWDFPEAAILHQVVGGFSPAVKYITQCLEKMAQDGTGAALQQDAMTSGIAKGKVVSTDPPYYDNVGYADLSDFFYVWLRRSLRSTFPELFATLAVPKAEELVATPYRHGNKEKAETFFLTGMKNAMQCLAEQTHVSFPVTIYYAFKQSETKGKAGTSSTGWETFLAAVIRAGFSITGTWPMRSEQQYRMVGLGTNALASSIVLVCRKRATDTSLATRRDFVAELRDELPTALANLQSGNIAPVDLAQASIGPGMAVYTRYAKVLDAAGNPVSVREALQLINQILDEVLTEQEGDFDADSRWALAWFEQYGFEEGEYGVAETLSNAMNTSIAGVVEGGILASGAGKVRLLRPEELTDDWDPATDSRLTIWEAVHHLVHALDTGGETAAANLARQLGGVAETARELAYRLYTVCERKKRPAEALSYNSLVQSWPEIVRLAKATSGAIAQQEEIF